MSCGHPTASGYLFCFQILYYISHLCSCHLSPLLLNYTELQLLFYQFKQENSPLRYRRRNTNFQFLNHEIMLINMIYCPRHQTLLYSTFIYTLQITFLSVIIVSQLYCQNREYFKCNIVHQNFAICNFTFLFFEIYSICLTPFN